MTLSVLTFAVTWAGCLTLAVAGAVSLGDRQQPHRRIRHWCALRCARRAAQRAWNQLAAGGTRDQRQVRRYAAAAGQRVDSSHLARTCRRRGGRRASDAALVGSDAGELRSPSPAATGRCSAARCRAREDTSVRHEKFACSARRAAHRQRDDLAAGCRSNWRNQSRESDSPCEGWTHHVSAGHEDDRMARPARGGFHARFRSVT